jgi:hypothetical protein
MRHSFSPEIIHFFLIEVFTTPLSRSFDTFISVISPATVAEIKKKIMRLLWNSVISYLLRLIRLYRTWREIKFSQIIHPLKCTYIYFSTDKIC